ncbi:MAG: hypothetical protein ABI683_03155 [Ginsengibacter sp.]
MKTTEMAQFSRTENSGSTKARTRLYRMSITKFYKEMQKDFYLYGQLGDTYPKFELDKDYDGF